MAARFRLDGKPAKISQLRLYRRHDVIELKSRRCPAEISVAGERFEVATPVTRAELDRFAGMNAHFTMSLDNDPEWIRDFALFHRRTQGLQAMVLFDNGSTRYPLSVVEDALQDAGLSDFAVVSVPLPYGPKATGPTASHAKATPAEGAAKKLSAWLITASGAGANNSAPDIVEAILEGLQPKNISLESLVSTSLPKIWDSQRKVLGFRSG